MALFQPTEDTNRQTNSGGNGSSRSDINQMSQFGRAILDLPQKKGVIYLYQRYTIYCRDTNKIDLNTRISLLFAGMRIIATATLVHCITTVTQEIQFH